MEASSRHEALGIAYWSPAPSRPPSPPGDAAARATKIDEDDWTLENLFLFTEDVRADNRALHGGSESRRCGQFGWPHNRTEEQAHLQQEQQPEELELLQLLEDRAPEQELEEQPEELELLQLLEEPTCPTAPADDRAQQHQQQPEERLVAAATTTPRNSVPALAVAGVAAPGTDDTSRYSPPFLCAVYGLIVGSHQLGCPIDFGSAVECLLPHSIPPPYPQPNNFRPNNFRPNNSRRPEPEPACQHPQLTCQSCNGGGAEATSVPPPPVPPPPVPPPPVPPAAYAHHRPHHHQELIVVVDEPSHHMTIRFSQQIARVWGNSGLTPEQLSPALTTEALGALCDDAPVRFVRRRGGVFLNKNEIGLYVWSLIFVNGLDVGPVSVSNPGIEVPLGCEHKTDVFSERGLFGNNYKGNIRWRNILERYLIKLYKGLEEPKKGAVALAIAQTFQLFGSRFLVRILERKPPTKAGEKGEIDAWSSSVVMTDEKAQQKVAQFARQPASAQREKKEDAGGRPAKAKGEKKRKRAG